MLRSAKDTINVLISGLQYGFIGRFPAVWQSIAKFRLRVSSRDSKPGRLLPDPGLGFGRPQTRVRVLQLLRVEEKRTMYTACTNEKTVKMRDEFTLEVPIGITV